MAELPKPVIRFSAELTPGWPEMKGFDFGDPDLAKEIMRRWNAFEPLLAACRYYEEAISSHPAEFVNVDRAEELARLMEIALKAAE